MPRNSFVSKQPSGPFNRKPSKKTFGRPASGGMSRLDVQYNANIEMQKFGQSIVDLISQGVELKKNHWAEIASVICCERSDVYLKALIKKTRDYYQDPKSLSMNSRKRKQRQEIHVTWSPPKRKLSGRALSNRSRKNSARDSARGTQTRDRSYKSSSRAPVP